MHTGGGNPASFARASCLARVATAARTSAAAAGSRAVIRQSLHAPRQRARLVGRARAPYWQSPVKSIVNEAGVDRFPAVSTAYTSILFDPSTAAYATVWVVPITVLSGRAIPLT